MSSNDDLLATIASSYYILNQSQGEIAKRLDMSTSKVSRLLKEARERGIVDIRINMPIPRDIELEQRLIDHFGLKDAYVLKTADVSNPQARTNAIGKLAANYIKRMLESFPSGASVGVAWGRGVHAAVTALPDNAATNINAVPLIGGIGTLAIDSPDVTRVVAQKLGGRHYDLHAPILVERPEVKDVLMSEPAVQVGIQRANEVHLAITGIGTVVDEASSFLRSGLLSNTDLAHLRSEGLVGEMCGHFYDIRGEYQRYEINRRIIGLDLNQLKRVELVMAVAYGQLKAEAIYGALQG
ncbi:MAG: sugar-binding transcriptional regulator, partial [Chloroflexota bacterium]